MLHKPTSLRTQTQWSGFALYSERQNLILDEVHKHGFVSIDRMADQYQVSTQTIRRDVNLLSEAGELRRVRGGVDKPVLRSNLNYARRSALNPREKQLIASLVADHVADGSSLAISIGTTPEIVIEALIGKPNLRIFTNNLNVAMLASAQSDWQVTIPGGSIRPNDRDVLGPAVEEFFAKYRVDYGIFGVGGVSPSGNLLDFTEDEVACRAVIQANCNESYLVLDHSKFSRRAFVRGGVISSPTKVFCDDTPPAPIVDLLKASQTPLITPEKDTSHA